MSKRNARASGCLIESPARPRDGLPEIGVLDRLALQEIDPPAEEGFQVRQQAEEAVRVLPGRHRREFHQEVEIAGLRIEVVAGRGAEEVQPFDPVLEAKLPQRLEPLLDDLLHCSSIPAPGPGSAGPLSTLDFLAWPTRFGRTSPESSAAAHPTRPCSRVWGTWCACPCPRRRGWASCWRAISGGRCWCWCRARPTP